MTRWIALLTLVLGLVVGGAWGTHTALTSAQDADPGVCVDTASPVADEADEPVESEQRLLGQADYSGLPAEPARLTTTQLTLAPGSSTQPFANPGPVLIIVQDGTVTLTADEASIGAPPEPTTGITVETEPVVPAAADAVGVTKGEQISLNANVNAQLTNDGTTAVRLLLITLNPSTAPAGA